MEDHEKTCPVCGATMVDKFYIDLVTKTATPNVWVCPNREDGKHPNPEEAESTGQ